MAMLLKQSTAVDIPLGPFVDSTDGFTAKTGLTIAQADVRLKKGAGNWAQKTDATSATHEENGWYEVPLDATDTGTLGPLMVAVNESGALPVWREFVVVPANIYDSFVSGTDVLDTSVTQWTGTAVATPDTAGYPKVTVKSGGGNGEVNLLSGAVLLQPTQTGVTIPTVTAVTNGVTVASNGIAAVSFQTGAITAGALAADAISAAALAADAGTEIADAVWDRPRALNTEAGSFGEGVASVQGNVTGSVGSIASGGIAAAAFASGAINATVLAPNCITSSELASTAIDAIADGILDRNMATGTDSGSATVRTMRQALRFLRNKWSLSGATLTVTKEDDTTTSWTAQVTTSGSAEPVTGSDPASS